MYRDGPSLRGSEPEMQGVSFSNSLCFSVQGLHTRRTLTVSTRPLSTRPSGLAVSPLLLCIGLALRVLAPELGLEFVGVSLE